MMARAAAAPPAGESCSTAAGTPVSNGAMSSCWPMTPVEARSTCSGSHPNIWETMSQVSRATARPGSPVAALALPELTATAWTRPQLSAPRCSRHTVTGAAQNRLVVNTPAALTGRSAASSAKSARSGLRRKPAWMPAALKPRALVTPPSGTARILVSNSSTFIGTLLDASTVSDRWDQCSAPHGRAPERCRRTC